MVETLEEGVFFQNLDVITDLIRNRKDGSKQASIIVMEHSQICFLTHDLTTVPASNETMQKSNAYAAAHVKKG